ncbi:MAG: FAD-dependent oxidoreductase [Rhodospirillales bacterium]
MSETLKPDICVIGAGSGGLSVAAGASQMGAPTVLIERAEMGGDCLNTGCVPSKALLAAGAAAQASRHRAKFGIADTEPDVDGTAVQTHVRGVIEAIAPMDSVERFRGLGVNVIKGHGRFVDRRTVEVDGTRIQARRFVLATGSTAAVPPIPGIESTPFYTNETIFSAQPFPKHLIVIGGGPIGCELAQAHRRLGVRVTLLEMFSVMPKDDPELVDVVRQCLLGEGIDIREDIKIARVEKAGSGVAVVLEGDDGEERIEGSDLLLATGRRPVVDEIGLDEAGIRHSPKGIEVDAGLRTSNRKVYAMGDCVGGLQFTHVAGYHASVVIKSALFRLPAKADHSSVPWVTYTSPELANVGLTEAQARERHGDAIRILRWPFHENDRAQAERRTGGMIKVITTKKGHVLGAAVVGPAAGEIIQTWVLAMSAKVKIGAIAGMISPYPTFGEVTKRAAGSFYTPTLFSDRTKAVVRFLRLFG